MAIIHVMRGHYEYEKWINHLVVRRHTPGRFSRLLQGGKSGITGSLSTRRCSGMRVRTLCDISLHFGCDDIGFRRDKTRRAPAHTQKAIRRTCNYRSTTHIVNHPADALCQTDTNAGRAHLARWTADESESFVGVGSKETPPRRLGG